MGRIDSQYSLEPFFFGESNTKLFGCYHPPREGPDKRGGILLCQPIGHEYIQSHRSFYQLAVQLARIGFHVLRFDYFGCGDSAGDFEKGSLGQWARDIQTAAKALVDRSHQSRISIIGLRLGATLAILASMQSDEFDALALWEPILDGKRYLEELTAAQEFFARWHKGDKKRESNTPGEILGFPLTPELRQDLEAINPDKLRLLSRRRTLTICNNSDGSCSEELNQFLRDHPHAESKTIDDHKAWHEEVYKRLIPLKTLAFLVNWIDKAHP